MKGSLLHASALILTLATCSFPFGNEEKAKEQIYIVPRAAAPPIIDAKDEEWRDIPQLILAKNSGKLLHSIDMSEIQTPPADSGIDWRAYRVSYKFQWDENHLYALVEVIDPVIDNGHVTMDNYRFVRNSQGHQVNPDFLYDTIFLSLKAPRWMSYTTEIHAFVRPPGAGEPLWGSLGRTVDEEDPYGIRGKAATSATSKGYIIELALPWLPSYDWKPNLEAEAGLELMASLSDTPDSSFEERKRKALFLVRLVSVKLGE